MSTALVEAEIKRFLRASKPEVLCLKGRWGVGKTFAWRKWLSEVQADSTLNAKKYAYVSLFGLNSLDSLRYSIFESTVTPEHLLTGPSVSTVSALVQKGFDLSRKSKSLLEPIAALIGAKDGGEALFRSAYMLVRDQLVCLDDLERAGDGLSPRDVLGLASSLKEQRNCKVALLLNDEEMAESKKKEFERQLEKVVDIPLVFDPSPEEAAAIALVGDTDLERLLRERTVQLGIVNIRVIKKIERMALRLQAILKGFPAKILEQGASAVVLGGWAVFQPNEAPPFATLKSYNRLVAQMKASKQQEPDEPPKWVEKLDGYPFLFADDFDVIVFEGVKNGYFNEAALIEAANELKAQLAQNSRDNSFVRAWNQYWHDLTVDDEKLLDDIFSGAMENLQTINPVNLSGTALLLRESGRDGQADKLVDAYVAARNEGKAFFDISEHHLTSDDKLDHRLVEKFAAKHAAFVDTRDPRQMLIEISGQHSWSDEDIQLLASLTSNQLVDMFRSIKGPELRRSVKFAHQLARSGSDDAKRLAVTLAEAMQTIAESSEHSKRRLRSWGVPL